LFKSIIGYNPIDKGLIKVNGNIVGFKDPNDALKYKICLLPEDREKEGLFSKRSVKENITISSLRKFLNRFKLINNKFEQCNVNRIINKLKIVTLSFNQEIENLSGGNKQKVIVGRLLETKPILYILDEPTKGIDVEAKQQILRFIIEDLSKEGSVLIASSEFEDLLQICDRIILLKKGKIVKEFNISEIDEKKLYIYLEALEN
jgi:ABC-type sugar transport system ATPase subunit